MRKTYTWTMAGRSIELGRRTAIMGILNLTPDSFSDGGRWDDTGRALDRAVEIEAAGADVLDVGGQSTRPTSVGLDAEEEIRRVMPALKRIGKAARIPVSIDTYHAEVARRAMDLGARIINDISGFRLDPEMVRLAATSGAGVVLMHSRGARDDLHVQSDDDTPEAIRDELGATLKSALEAGIASEAIVLDPGIGFSKGRQTSLKVLKRLNLFSTLGHPLLVGPSRKSFIKVDIRTAEAPDWGTAAAVAIAIQGGAHIVRVHDVSRMRAAVEVADLVTNAG